MGNKLKEARDAAGMTQCELAEKSGVSRTTISNIENDVEKVASSKTLLALANALNTTVSQIFF